MAAQGKEEDEEIIASNHEPVEADASLFDDIVGALQDVLGDPEFQELQGGFCRQHCDVFEDSDENKLEYTPIFEEYVATVESYIEERLARDVEGFDMAWFAHRLADRADEVGDEIMDVLMSFTEFDEFKGLMLSHKAGAVSLAVEAAPADAEAAAAGLGIDLGVGPVGLGPVGVGRVGRTGAAAAVEETKGGESDIEEL